MARELLSKRKGEYLRFDNLPCAILSNMKHLALVGGELPKKE